MRVFYVVIIISRSGIGRVIKVVEFTHTGTVQIECCKFSMSLDVVNSFVDRYVIKRIRILIRKIINAELVIHERSRPEKIAAGKNCSKRLAING